MIKINLATLKQSGVGADGKGKLSVSSLSSYVDKDKFKELPFKKVITPIVIGAVSSFMLDNYKEDEKGKMTALLGKINAENVKLQADLAKYKSYDSVKLSLDQDEISIKTKLETIQKLISDRNVPLKILTTLANSIPQDVWLTDCKISSTTVSLKGLSMGFTQISDFMKALRESVYFASVELVSTEQGKEKAGSEIASFELAIKRR